MVVKYPDMISLSLISSDILMTQYAVICLVSVSGSFTNINKQFIGGVQCNITISIVTGAVWSMT